MSEILKAIDAKLDKDLNERIINTAYKINNRSHALICIARLKRANSIDPRIMQEDKIATEHKDLCNDLRKLLVRYEDGIREGRLRHRRVETIKDLYKRQLGPLIGDGAAGKIVTY